MFNNKKILVTGGGGFIGLNLLKKLLNETNSFIYNLDKLNYASNLKALKDLEIKNNKYQLLKIDLINYSDLEKAIKEADPDIIFHFAAESHVDRSILTPEIFIQSNILGTFNLLKASSKHWGNLSSKRKNYFKFHHISTDEVFGSLSEMGKFNENTKYDPRSPYSASKASSDHLVSAWFHTYDFPVITTNCSNNYGPYQFKEKLIPMAINKCINNESIPLYGDGKNIRDWLYVEDHIEAILQVIEKGELGKKYCIGGNNEIKNIDVLKKICAIMDILKPQSKPYFKLIKKVSDRLGHDRRYSIDTTLIYREIGWQPRTNFEEGLKKTIKWYLENIY